MKVGAFFDVDGTLLSKSSGTLYGKFLLKEGKIGLLMMAKVLWWHGLYRFGRLEAEKITRKLVADYEGNSEAEMIADCLRWYNNTVRHYIRPQLVETIGWHRKQGHNIALLTAATIYISKPLGDELGVDGYICNRLGVKDGKFTGQMVEPMVYGVGKVHHAEKYAVENDIDLAKSYFYTDSITDLDFLVKVGHPVVINPDSLLRREAGQRGWPVYDYAHELTVSTASAG